MSIAPNIAPGVLPEPGAPDPAALPVRLLHLDPHLVIVSKPSGMLVHRGQAADRVVLMTRVRDLLGHWVWPCHRLDRGTSGVMMLARSRAAAGRFGRLFERGEVEKRYLAIVRGVPEPEGVIDHPIPRTAARGAARVPSLTRYRLLESWGRYALVEALPESGRIHQIRRHLKHIDHPIIGDTNYGDGVHNRHFRSEHGLWRLALHAAEIAFDHPYGGHRLHVGAPLPADLASALAGLRTGPRTGQAVDRPEAAG